MARLAAPSAREYASRNYTADAQAIAPRSASYYAAVTQSARPPASPVTRHRTTAASQRASSLKKAINGSDDNNLGLDNFSYTRVSSCIQSSEQAIKIQQQNGAASMHASTVLFFSCLYVLESIALDLLIRSREHRRSASWGCSASRSVPLYSKLMFCFLPQINLGD